MMRWQIHYTGAPHSGNSYGDLIAKGQNHTGPELDQAWRDNGCHNNPHSYTIYLVSQDGQLVPLSEAP